MPKRVKQYGLALVGVGVAVGVIAPAVIAAGTDTDDFVKPVSTVVQTSLAPGTRTTFVATIGPATVTSTCTASSTSGTTPAHGLVMAVKPMSFGTTTSPGYCPDNLGGGDIWKTSGIWHVTFLDAPNDETTEPPAGPNSGDHLRITIPIKGITITSTIDPTCLVTVAPNAAVQVVGRYNDHNRLTVGFPGAPVPIKYAATGSPGCPGGNGSGTGHFRATYVLSPGVHDGS